MCSALHLKAIQNLFPFLSFKFKVESTRYTEYNGILPYFNLKSLNKRRDNLRYTFFIKLNNSFDCPYLQSQLNF